MQISMYQASVPVFQRMLGNLVAILEKAAASKTIDYLGTLREEQFAGAEERTVSWPTRTGSRSMQGLPYLLTQVQPNLYFHTTTAYNILRHNGVEVGKQDYLGPQ